MLDDDFADNLAILSLIVGIAAMVFALFAQKTLLEPLAPLGGALAIYAGIRVLRGAANNKKLAVTGTITGTIAVAFWLILMAYRMAVFVWNLIF